MCDWDNVLVAGQILLRLLEKGFKFEILDTLLWDPGLRAFRLFKISEYVFFFLHLECFLFLNWTPYKWFFTALQNASCLHLGP